MMRTTHGPGVDRRIVVLVIHASFRISIFATEIMFARGSCSYSRHVFLPWKNNRSWISL